ncbi:hypothetical protein [Streptomyces sp. NPDC002580]|uniref:hypothetical protein n=1 Tax=Streptomyces sp. NPDC002580 TaxID=3364653 RepID=UPI0036A4C187
MISSGRPDEDATVVRYGKRQLLQVLPFVVVLIGSSAMGLWSAVHGTASSWMALLLGIMGVTLLVSAWRARRWITVFDSTGFWWMRGKEIALIRWDSLAGAGIYWARGSKSVVFTVELCPKGEIDRDDPLLWKFVRDTDPIRPDLPRLRYRIDVRGSDKLYEKALRQWAPDLWFGRKEQPYSYPGQQDRQGHRDRLAGRTGPAADAASDALVLDTVEIGDSVVVHRGGVLVRRRLAAASVMVAACAWAAWALVPEHGHGVGAVVRDGLAAALVLLTSWALVTIARGVGYIWNQRVTMDAAGVHVSRRGRSATVPWESLTGVGIHGTSALHTLELCPKDEIDRDDPMLWIFVRDSEPAQPGRPRLRHRVSVRPGSARHAVAAGCRRWAPDLWFGAQRMPPGYEGTPDVKGHRRRTREAAAPAVTPAQ